MNDEQKITRRIGRYRKIEEANPEKYCWADLVMRAMEQNVYERFDRGCEGADSCKLESEDVGHCYCRKFVNGKLDTVDPELRESVG